MKNLKISLDIEKPCSENFNSFAKTQKGGFCKNCSKEVIDFTKFSKDEISDYFKQNNSSKTCGVFHKFQLEKKYDFQSDVNKKNYSLSTFKFNVASFYFLSLLSLNSFSQHSSTKNKTEIHQENIENEKNTTNSEYYTGTVISKDDGMPLPGAYITVRGTKISTSSDFDGNFIIAKNLVNENSEVVITYPGFHNVVLKVTDLNDTIGLEEFNIGLESACVTMGEVATHEVYTTKQSFFQRVVGWFK